MRLSLLATVLLAGCTANLPIDPTTLVTCKTDGDCPSPLVCVNAERCADPTALDTNGPTLATPGQDALLAAAAPVVFTWSVVTGALRYHLVVTDEAGNVVIDETLAATSFSATMHAGTYNWHIVSDITDASLGVVSQRFGVVDDAIFVYCGDEDCGVTTGELGTAALPFRSISRGINAALGAGVSIVRIAKRLNDAAYGEAVYVKPGVTLSGGYARDFATQTGRTNIALADTSLFAAFVFETTGIEHLAFTTTGGATTSPVASIFRCSNALTLLDVALTTTSWATEVLRVEEKSDDAGPQLVDSLVTATTPLGEAPHAPFQAIVLNNASLTLRGTTVQGATASALDSKATSVSLIDVTNGLLSATDSTLMLDVSRSAPPLPDQTAYVVGVALTGASYVSHGSSLTIRATNFTSAIGVETLGTNGKAELVDSTVDVAAPTAYAIYLSDKFHAVTAVRSRLVSNATSVIGFAQAVRGLDTTIVDIESSFVTASAAGASDGLHFEKSAYGLIASTTIVVTRGVPRAIYAEETSLRIVNNLIVGPGGCSAFCAGVVLAGADAYLTLDAFANNAIVGYPTVNATSCPLVATGTTYAKCVSPNAAATTNPRPYLAANLTLDAIADAELDPVTYRPNTMSPLAQHGIDPDSDVCRQIGNASDFTITPPACGGTSLDFEGQPLEAPKPSIGYLRAAP